LFIKIQSNLFRYYIGCKYGYTERRVLDYNEGEGIISYRVQNMLPLEILLAKL